jgi:hypothetical protein
MKPEINGKISIFGDLLQIHRDAMFMPPPAGFADSDC